MDQPGDTNQPDGKWQCLAGASQILIRSQIEIARYLNEFAQREVSLTATVSKERYLFVTQLLHADPNHQFIMVDYCGNRTVNSALLASPSVTFSAPHGSDHIDFIAAHPVDGFFNGGCCVRLDYPATMMLNQRRKQDRVTVIPAVPLRCLADTGGILSFECTIVDISRGGLGTMIYDNAIFLDPGTVLKDCRIFCAGHVIELDMEVRYSVATTLADGRTAQRAGFRFPEPSDKLDELINLFVLKIEGPQP